ncbi:MAG TPA: GNAT family N-acetyltransferase [Phycisphaerales bacterium]|nr:GNAT family N-acetyltransferase [Phycisphaerales bacterium]
MSTTLAPAQPHDHAAVSRLISLAFGSPMDGVSTWLENAGLHNFRVMRANSEASGGAMPIACALRVPMGHFFGGRSIRNMGVAGVAVAPEARGGGLATTLMAEFLREARSEGYPLASLYPATLPLYRRVGFEQAGYWCEYRINLKLLKLDPSLECGGDRDLKVRAFDRERDLDAVHVCYRAFAMQHEGMLDRGDYIWGRIFKPRQGEATGLVVEQQGGDGTKSVVGYIFFRQERTPALDHDVIVSDMAATTPAAARRLLDMLSDFRSVGAELSFNGGPNHPFVSLLAEQKLTMKLREYWMLRVLDVEAALTQRGYNPHVSCTFTLDVRDATFPENAGPWRVEVHNGKAGVSRGAAAGGSRASSDDTLTLDARTLAAMYSGFHTPQQLRSVGKLRGGDRGVLAAAAAFAGATPSLQDMF